MKCIIRRIIHTMICLFILQGFWPLGKHIENGFNPLILYKLRYRIF